jgi:hypothetical protein
MKKVLVIACLALLSGCSIYMSGYQNKPLTIDGLSSDWNTTLENKGSGVSYGISNDSENLYIRLNISDQTIQRKIFMAGLTIWVDTTGKKKEKVGIICPIQKAPAKMDRNAMKKMNSPPAFDKNQILEAEFIGFAKSIQTYYLDNNPYGIEVSFDVDEFKSMYYEMRIPLSTIYKNNVDLSSKLLSIGIETGAIEMPDRDQMSANMGGGRSGGSGSGRPGGSGGGRSGGMGGSKTGGMGSSSGGSQSDMSSLTNPTKFWVKNIKLAL